MPALMRAQKIQNKAATIGFDWSNINDVIAKLEEEIVELKEALQKGDKGSLREEIGDILFSAVNVSRFLKIDATEALDKSIGKFMDRFAYMENKFTRQGKEINDANFAELNTLWKVAKKRRS